MNVTIPFQSCEYVLDHLNSEMLNPTPEDIATFSSSCHALFPLATAFRPSKPEEESVQR